MRRDLRAARGKSRLSKKIASEEIARGPAACQQSAFESTKVAHHVRTASQYGIMSQTPVTDMAKVQEYLDAAIQQIYKPHSGRARKGMDVTRTRAVRRQSVDLGWRQDIRSKHFLITRALAIYSTISGLDSVPYLTYDTSSTQAAAPLDDRYRSGPIGAEIAQAYQRLGCQVTIVAERLLPKEDPDVRQLLQQVFEREGIRFVWSAPPCAPR